MWIWQQADWPNFIWDEKVIEPKLRDIRFHQGMLLGKMSSQPKRPKAKYVRHAIGEHYSFECH